MKFVKRTLPIKKNIALIAHDHCKTTLLDWCKTNKNILKKHHLFATGTTGALIEKQCQINVASFLSGPMGGDQQIGAKIAEREIDVLIFFWDPLNAVSHDPDVKALLRLAVVWNIPFASNRATADALMGSDLFKTSFTIDIPDYKAYLNERTQ